MKHPIELPYSYDALEPVLDTKTVAIHYNNHYLNYVKKLNDLFVQAPELESVSNIEIAKHLDLVPLSIRDRVAVNLGGVLNHELYFSELSPTGSREPKGSLKKAIEEQYGSYENFKQAYLEETKKLVGSGYTFLVVTKNKTLQLLTLSNQDTPYYYDMIPIMTIDLWEHAYYLTYQSNRDQYVKNFFQIVNYDVIEQNYEQALQET